MNAIHARSQLRYWPTGEERWHSIVTQRPIMVKRGRVLFTSISRLQTTTA